MWWELPLPPPMVRIWKLQSVSVELHLPTKGSDVAPAVDMNAVIIISSNEMAVMKKRPNLFFMLNLLLCELVVPASHWFINDKFFGTSRAGSGKGASDVQVGDRDNRLVVKFARQTCSFTGGSSPQRGSRFLVWVWISTSSLVTGLSQGKEENLLII